MSVKPFITVYVISHNYGNFLTEAVESVLRQTFEDWELILINDGSSDNTQEIINLYKNHPKISSIQTEGIGLPAVNNLALKEAKGKYIIRLDGDDIFEENILLIFSNYVKKNEDISLIFPDFYLMNENGETFAHEITSSPHTDDHLMDFPPNGACTMVKTKVLRELGGYREDLGAQDGLDLWLKLKDKFLSMKVNLPLFYYRRHGKNLTENPIRIINARRQIKKSAIETKLKTLGPIMAIIPCRRNYDFTSDLWSLEIDNKSLLQRDIELCLESDLITNIVVTCDNLEVQETISSFDDKRIKFHLRKEENTFRSSNIALSLKDIMKEFNPSYEGLSVLSYVQTPFVSTGTLEEALTSLVTSDSESSCAVQEIQYRVYEKGSFGLNSINTDPDSFKGGVKLFQDTSTCIAFRNQNLKKGSVKGARVSGFSVSSDEAFFISSAQDLVVAKEIQKLRDNE